MEKQHSPPDGRGKCVSRLPIPFFQGGGSKSRGSRSVSGFHAPPPAAQPDALKEAPSVQPSAAHRSGPCTEPPSPDNTLRPSDFDIASPGCRKLPPCASPLFRSCCTAHAKGRSQRGLVVITRTRLLTRKIPSFHQTLSPLPSWQPFRSRARLVRGRLDRPG